MSISLKYILHAKILRAAREKDKYVVITMTDGSKIQGKVHGNIPSFNGKSTITLMDDYGPNEWSTTFDKVRNISVQEF